MKKIIKLETYEEYHKDRGVQKRIINNNDYTYWNILPFLKKYFTSKMSVLDIGCGTGTLSLYLASSGSHTLGIDISKKGIEACRKNAKNLQIENAVYQVMEFPNILPKRKFDAVILSEVIEHLPDDNHALEAIYKLLKSDGVLLLSTPSLNAPLYRLGLLKDFDIEVGHLRRYKMRNLIEKCKKHNFKVIESKKTEGIFRNFLYTNSFAGNFVWIINKLHASIPLAKIDRVLINLFGESQIILVLRKTV